MDTYICHQIKSTTKASVTNLLAASMAGLFTAAVLSAAVSSN